MVRAPGATHPEGRKSRNVSHCLRANDRPDMTEPAPAGTTFRDVRVRCYPPNVVIVNHEATDEHKQNNALRHTTAPACRLPVALIGNHKEGARCATAFFGWLPTGNRHRRPAKRRSPAGENQPKRLPGMHLGNTHARRLRGQGTGHSGLTPGKLWKSMNTVIMAVLQGVSGRVSQTVWLLIRRSTVRICRAPPEFQALSQHQTLAFCLDCTASRGVAAK